MKVISPQEGFQQQFLSCSADIALGGGAAGAGKTFVLLLEVPRHTHNKDWNAVIFRRTIPQITNQGGLWDTAESLFMPMMAGTPASPKKLSISQNRNSHTFTWKDAATLQFSHLQHEKDKLTWQGAQIGYLGFDELTHFTESQFFYMLTRNRSASGIRPYTRATCNPQGDGWVKDMVQWYLYPDDYPDHDLASYPIPERAGVLRYFTRYKGAMVWGNTKTEVLEALPAEIAKDYTPNDIKSFTFIPGTLDHNQILMKIDPGYKGNLLAQEDIIKQQLLLGRWANAADGMTRLFEKRALLDFFSNDFVPHGHKYITADIALEGNDKLEVVAWSGWRIIEIQTVDKSAGDEVLRVIRDMARVHSVPNSRIAYDADGVGGYLKGFLRGAIPIHNGGTPIEVEGVKERYRNLKTQLYYYTARKINKYEACASGITDEGVITSIIEEMYAHRKVIKSGMPYDMTRKDEVSAEIGRSPDKSDAICLRAIFDLVPTGRKGSSSTAI